MYQFRGVCATCSGYHWEVHPHWCFADELPPVSETSSSSAFGDMLGEISTLSSFFVLEKNSAVCVRASKSSARSTGQRPP